MTAFAQYVFLEERNRVIVLWISLYNIYEAEYIKNKHFSCLSYLLTYLLTYSLHGAESFLRS